MIEIGTGDRHHDFKLGDLKVRWRFPDALIDKDLEDHELGERLTRQFERDLLDHLGPDGRLVRGALD